MTDQLTSLTWDVFVASPEPLASGELAPGEAQAFWSPVSATLISGERDAVLVDALLTVSQAEDLTQWVAATGKNLTAVYITHGHGDHWFGLGTVLTQFPDARALALPSAIEHARAGSSPEFLDAFWNPRFSGRLPSQLVLPDPLEQPAIELEGHQLLAVEFPHTDTDHTSGLWVPDVRLLVAGDAAYNDVHLYLAESDHQGRLDWIAALDRIESLDPQTVIAGHQRAGRHDGPTIIEETRQYIRDFDRLFETAGTARELYDQVLELHPDRINPNVLWLSANALKPEATPAESAVNPRWND